MDDNVAKTRGSKSASIEANFTGDKPSIGKVIHDNYRWFNYSAVKTDEECAERINEFFRVCNEENSFPTVEKLALALGVVRETLHAWQTRRSDMGAVRSDMIKKAKEILAGIDADLVQSGKIPQITYIFRAKNFFGMVDKQDVTITPNQQQDSDFDVNEIRQRYLLDSDDSSQK
ncbi:hypothetical protein FACS189499_03770 [Clostridia bacterium]|nr:hypothetical protein FACS189499_03770 [Clostridia bacterium]